MPDTKLTWKGLLEHLRKYLWFYILGSVLTVVLSDLLYAMVSPRTPQEKVVRFYVVDEYTEFGAFDPFAEQILTNFQEEGQDIIEVAFDSINYADMESDYQSSMLLTLRMAGGDGDIYLCNRKGYEYICGAEVAMALDSYLADGWLSDMELTTAAYDDEENGVSYTAAIVLDDGAKLWNMGFYSDTLYISLAANSTNPETSMMAIEDFLEIYQEFTYDTGD